MARIKIRHLTIRKDATGAPRYYWQPSRLLKTSGFKLTRLPDTLEDAIKTAEVMNLDVDNWREGKPCSLSRPTRRHISPGSVAAMISHYKDSLEYKCLRKKTQHGYEQWLKLIHEFCGDAPAAAISRTVVQQFYRKLQTSETKTKEGHLLRRTTLAKANAVIRVMRRLFQYGVNQGLISANPASSPAMVSTKPRQEIWAAEAIAAVIDMADREGRRSIGTAILLGAYLGQREGDILHLSWTQYKNGVFCLKQSKTGRIVEVPAAPVLRARLDQTPRTAATILVSEATGKPFDGNHFRHTFARLRKKAGVSGLFFMDLRRTAVVRLAEAGCTEAEIAAVTGHQIESCRRILEVYLLRTGKMAAAAIHKLTQNGG